MAHVLTLRGTMRLTGTMLCAYLVAGCASHAKHEGAGAGAAADLSSHESTIACFDDGEARRASALVFDPPVAAGQPPLELARADRERAAFVSYDEVFSTYFYLRMDDRQKLSNDGTSERRVMSETFGISRR